MIAFFYSKLSTLSIIFFTILLLFSCSPENLTNDPSSNDRLKEEAYKFLFNSPKYFIPTGAYPSGDGTRTDYGNVCWTPSGLVGANYRVDDIFQYRLRLDRASPNNQTNYSEYQIGNDGGFPGTDENGVQYPEYMHQAGYICYSLYSFLDGERLDHILIHSIRQRMGA